MVRPPYEVATEYQVSCFPIGHEAHRYLHITVVWRSPNRYAVLDNQGNCIGKRGNRGREGLPSSRTDRFKNAYRFPIYEAMRIARREAPKLTINGLTVQNAIDGKYN